MNKKILFILINLIFIATNAQQSYWSKTTDSKINSLEKLERGTEVLRYDVYNLNFELLKTKLKQAPDRNQFTESNIIIDFPNSNGELEKFKVFKADVLHPDLAKKYENIRSYIGIGIDDKSATIRFSTTIFGFHGMILSGRNHTTYIDPYTTDLNNYIVYDKRNTKTNKPFECGTESTEIEVPSGAQFRAYRNTAGTSQLRKYRLAMACTIEYAAYHSNAAGLGNGTVAQKKAATLAAMNVTVTRINSIYERDLSITLEIIPTNENIIFITSDSLNNSSSSQLLGQIQSVVDAGVGFNSYDIGHVVSTGGGGIAQLYSPCSPSKARGVTGSSNPVGDPFDVDYVAHEMGHQFGANHTQNNSCQRNETTSMEPGSASTIMGYAGICAPNVQGNSDAYFHAVSLQEIKSFITTYGNCAVITDSGNSAPIIQPIFNKSIPKGTAFYLDATASDPENDLLTYTWEQINPQISTQPPVASNTQGPNYRSRMPSTSSKRYFPNFTSVIQNNLTPAWEVTPSVGRNLSFAVTVRDNNIAGGEFTTSSVNVNVSNIAGPFKVTSQQAQETWLPGSEQTITWDVAGTNSLPVETASVRILLSTNGGLTFDHILAENTPNDGNHVVVAPNLISTNSRILIEAIGNIYYAVNSAEFIIGDCSAFTNSVTSSIPDGIGPNQAGATLISTLNVTDNKTIEDLKVSVNISHSYIGDLSIILEHPNGTQIPLWNRNCSNNRFGNINVTFDDSGSAITCSTPTLGTFTPFGSLSSLNGLNSLGEWKLLVNDSYNSDTGNLNSWSLDFGCNETSASIEDVTTNKFKVYPNPNNGNFSIDYISSSESNQITIELFDIKGRKVYQEILQNSESINKIINLNSLQSGMYLIKLIDGKESIHQKIIIQ